MMVLLPSHFIQATDSPLDHEKFSPNATADSYEPDDSFEEATLIEDGDVHIHSISPVGDHDFVIFTLTETRTAIVETGGDQVGDHDTLLYLYDENETQIKRDDDGGVGLYSRIEMPLTPGVYYAMASRLSDGGEIEEYSLSFSTTDVTTDDYEPNDDMEHATPITEYDYQYHSLVPAEDVDWLVFETPSNGSVLFSCYVDYDEATRINMSLYNSNGTVIADASVQNAYTLDIRSGVPQGALYVRINSSVPNTMVSEYRINFQFDSIEPDEYEPDNSFIDATPILLNTSQVHSIAPAGDHDFLVFNVSQPIIVDIRTPHIEDEGRCMCLSLQDEQGNSIMSAYDGDNELCARIVVGLDNGTYYIEAYDLNSYQSVAAYGISLDEFSYEPDEYEPDNSIENANELQESSSQQHGIVPAGDVDYFSFSIPMAAVVSIYVNWHFSNCSAAIELFDQYGELILSESSTSSVSAQIDIELDAGLYYFAVSGYSASDLIPMYSARWYVQEYFAFEILYPEGGDFLAAGRSHTIRWSSNEETIPRVDILLHKGYSRVWEIVEDLPNTGEFVMTLAENTQYGDDYRIEIQASNDWRFDAWSAYFTIGEATDDTTTDEDEDTDQTSGAKVAIPLDIVAIIASVVGLAIIGCCDLRRRI